MRIRILVLYLNKISVKCSGNLNISMPLHSSEYYDTLSYIHTNHLLCISKLFKQACTFYQILLGTFNKLRIFICSIKIYCKYINRGYKIFCHKIDLVLVNCY